MGLSLIIDYQSYDLCHGLEYVVAKRLYRQTLF